MAHALVRVKLCSGVRTAQTWNVLGQVYPPGLVPGLGGLEWEGRVTAEKIFQLVAAQQRPGVPVLGFSNFE